MLFFVLVLIQLAIFAVLILFLRVILARNITKATTHLHSLNEDYSQKIEEANKRHADAEKYYDDTLLNAKTDAEKAKVAILKEANETQEKILTDSRRQGQEILEQANRAKEAMLKEVEDRIEQDANARACELVREVLPREAGAGVHAAWIKELFKNGFEGLGRLNLPEDAAQAEVQTAFPMSEAEKKQLQEILKDKMGRSVRIAEKVDEGLIAGCRIVLGSVVIDGSLKSKLKEASRRVDGTR